MDKFEQFAQKLAQMPLDERIEALKAERAKCICMNCPTYTECAEKLDQGFFCFTGTSIICIDQEVGCLCPTCPVPQDTGLQYTAFYCTQGNEAERRFVQSLTEKTK
jgi:hypothetical protein